MEKTVSRRKSSAEVVPCWLVWAEGICRGLSWPLDCEGHQGIAEKVMGPITNNQGLKAGMCGNVLTY